MLDACDRYPVNRNDLVVLFLFEIAEALGDGIDQAEVFKATVVAVAAGYLEANEIRQSFGIVAGAFGDLGQDAFLLDRIGRGRAGHNQFRSGRRRGLKTGRFGDERFEGRNGLGAGSHALEFFYHARVETIG